MLMRTLWMMVVMLGAVETSAALAQAIDGQEQLPLPARAVLLAEHATEAPELLVSDPVERLEELEEWMEEFSKWKNWMAQWGNRREPGWFSGFRQRRQRPDPPEWLFDRCQDSSAETGTVADACMLLAEWSADAKTTHAASTRAAATAGAEDGDKTIWWEHVHLDAGWPAMQSGVSLYGVIGMHATTTVKGRLEIFVAPGAMLLNVPTTDGGRAWKLATNYGIAYRLGEFKFPGDRRALLHINLAKAWLLATGPEVPTKSTDFVGLSITFKRRP
jgi:hypothetical protein